MSTKPRTLVIDDLSYTISESYISHDMFQTWHKKGDLCYECESLAWCPRRRPLVVKSVDPETGTIVLDYE